MTALTNLRNQLVALERFYAQWPLVAEMQRRGRVLIHPLHADEQAPRLTFICDEDAAMAGALFRGEWHLEYHRHAAEDGPRGYIRFTQRVLGVDVSYCAPIEDENHHGARETANR